METKFTPGPWRLSPHYKAGWSGVAKDPTPNRWQGIYEAIPGQDLGSKSTVISVGIEGSEVDDYWLSIKENDARLIAAAPDLYEALFEARIALESRCLNTVGLHEQIDRALAKAEGR